MCTANLHYNDAPWQPLESMEGTFVHEDIPRDLAEYIGVKMVRAEVLKKLAAKDFPFGDPFGQKEELTTRIRNILDEYSGEIDIFKELIQNADDSGAKQVHFVIDERTHGSEKVFNENSKHIQGPSLTVYNDQSFKKEDYEGLQNLGIG